MRALQWQLLPVSAESVTYKFVQIPSESRSDSTVVWALAPSRPSRRRARLPVGATATAAKHRHGDSGRCRHAVTVVTAPAGHRGTVTRSTNSRLPCCGQNLNHDYARDVRFSKTVDESNLLIIPGRLGIQVRTILCYDRPYHSSDHHRATRPRDRPGGLGLGGVKVLKLDQNCAARHGDKRTPPFVHDLR